MTTPIQLKKLVTEVLEEHKATNINAFDVRKITDISDYLIICSATSSRHIKALADHIIEQVKKCGIKPIGYEGRKGEHGWALIDLGDIIIHIMIPEIREFYNLEKLWEIKPMAITTKKSSKKTVAKRKVTKVKSVKMKKTPKTKSAKKSKSTKKTKAKKR